MENKQCVYENKTTEINSIKANASEPSLMEIEQGIENLTIIKLLESDKMGEGANAPVYKY